MAAYPHLYIYGVNEIIDFVNPGSVVKRIKEDHDYSSNLYDNNSNCDSVSSQSRFDNMKFDEFEDAFNYDYWNS